MNGVPIAVPVTVSGRGGLRAGETKRGRARQGAKNKDTAIDGMAVSCVSRSRSAGYTGL